MKLDFLTFPSMFCQARHRWVTFNKFSFPLGGVSFRCLNDPCKNQRASERSPPASCGLEPPFSWLLHERTCNFYIKRTYALYYVPSLSHTRHLAPQPQLSGEPLFSPWSAPKATAAPKGRLSAGRALRHRGCQSRIICKTIWFLGQATRRWWWPSTLKFPQRLVFLQERSAFDSGQIPMITLCRFSHRSQPFAERDGGCLMLLHPATSPRSCHMYLLGLGPRYLTDRAGRSWQAGGNGVRIPFLPCRQLFHPTSRMVKNPPGKSKGLFSTSYPKSVRLPSCAPLAGGRTNRDGFHVV